MADTGLLLSMAVGEDDFLKSPLYKSIVLGKSSSNEGMMMENLACQMPSVHHRSMYFYEKTFPNRARYEVDFVCPKGAKFDLYEIKSGRSNKAASLRYVSSVCKKQIDERCILWSSDIKVDDGIVYLPLAFAAVL